MTSTYLYCRSLFISRAQIKCRRAQRELLGKRFSDELELSDPEAIELSDSESIGTMSRSSMEKDRFKRIAKQSLNEV